jgi:hypothetical protein
MGEQIKTWIRHNDFQKFANEMGFSALIHIGKQIETLQDLETFMEVSIGEKRISNFDDLVERKHPISLFCCDWSPLILGRDHTSVMDAEKSKTCQASFRNTGTKSGTGKVLESREGTMRQCARTFTELSDYQAQDLPNRIKYVQKAPTEKEYKEHCANLILGRIEYENKDTRAIIDCNIHET